MLSPRTCCLLLLNHPHNVPILRRFSSTFSSSVANAAISFDSLPPRDLQILSALKGRSAAEVHAALWFEALPPHGTGKVPSRLARLAALKDRWREAPLLPSWTLKYARQVQVMRSLLPYIPCDVAQMSSTTRDGAASLHRLRGLPTDIATSTTGKWLAFWKRHLGASVKELCDDPRVPVVLYLHGGAFIVGRPQMGTDLLLSFARDGMLAIGVDYPRAPDETCIPGMVDFCVNQYLQLVQEMQVDPRRIVLAGDSAGGALVLHVARALHQQTADPALLPRALIAMSPWVDLARSFDELVWEHPRALMYDYLPPGSVVQIARSLWDPSDLKNPALSLLHDPSFGEAWVPPTLLTYGELEIFRPQVEAMATLLRREQTQRGTSRHRVHMWRDQIHAFEIISRGKAWAADGPESHAMLCSFVRETTGL